MKKFNVSIDADATLTIEVEAKSQEEAYEKAEKLIRTARFEERYRNECGLLDMRVYYDN